MCIPRRSGVSLWRRPKPRGTPKRMRSVSTRARVAWLCRSADELRADTRARRVGRAGCSHERTFAQRARQVRCRGGGGGRPGLRARTARAALPRPSGESPVAITAEPSSPLAVRNRSLSQEGRPAAVPPGGRRKAPAAPAAALAVGRPLGEPTYDCRAGNGDRAISVSRRPRRPRRPLADQPRGRAGGSAAALRAVPHRDYSWAFGRDTAQSRRQRRRDSGLRGWRPCARVRGGPGLSGHSGTAPRLDRYSFSVAPGFRATARFRYCDD